MDKVRVLLSLELSNAIKDINWTIQRTYNVEYMKQWNNYSLDKILMARISLICYVEPYVGYLVVQLSTSSFTYNIDPNLYTNGTCEITHSKYYNGKYKILLAQKTTLIISCKQFIYPDYIHIIIKPKPSINVPDIVSENILIYGQNLDTLRETSFYQHVGSLTRTHGTLIHKRSFSLYPEQWQPSGTLNFNVIKNKQLQILFDRNFIEDVVDNNDSLIVNIIGKSYNALTREKGYCKLLYGY